MIEAGIGIGILVGGTAGLLGLLALADRFSGPVVALGFTAALVGGGAMIGHVILHGDHSIPPWMIVVGGAGALLLVLGLMVDDDR